MRQPIPSMVPESRRRVRPATQQPMKRCCVQPDQRLLVCRLESGHLQLHRLLQPCRRLTCRRSQGVAAGVLAVSFAGSTNTPTASPPLSSCRSPGHPSAPSILATARLPPPPAALDSPWETVSPCREPRAGVAAIIANTSSQTCCSSSPEGSRYSRSPFSRRIGGSPSRGLALIAAVRSAISNSFSTDRRSTHTDPPRSARTTSATASATRSSDSPPRVVRRCATCTSAGSNTPTSSTASSIVTPPPAPHRAGPTPPRPTAQAAPS